MKNMIKVIIIQYLLMTGPISVIIRNKNDPSISCCIHSFNEVCEGTFELVIVDSSDHPMNFGESSLNIRYFYEKLTRFRALNLGIKMANFEKVLIIDSDQIVSSTLISELVKINEDMCIIREQSYNKNFIGRISDRHREFLYRHSKRNFSESLPVIPRLYRRKVIEKAISKIKTIEQSMISQHEDSILYSEALKISRNIGFCDIPILNIDPGFVDFARKSFKYGISQSKALSSNSLSNDRAYLLSAIDRNRVIYSKSEGFNTGILYDLLKATFYVPGLLFGKIYG